MKIIPLTDELLGQWDGYVANHPEASPYHASAWGKAVEEAYSHHIRHLCAYDDGKIVGVLPLIEMHLPFLKGPLVALPFCDLGMPVSDSPEISAQLVQAAKSLLADEELRGLELRSVDKADDPPNENSSGFKVSMLLDLPASSEQLWKNFKSKLRSQIRKAEKNGLTVEVGSSPGLISEFYQVFSINMRDLGSPVHSKQWFLSLQNFYTKQMIVSIVKKDGLPVGGGIVLVAGENAAIPWASTRADYNRLAPNMLLYWSLLKEVCDRGGQTFDFGRSTVDEGTYRFKKQWGATPVPLQWQRFNRFGELIPDDAVGRSGKLRKIIESLWQQLPVSLTVMIGPKIRRYVSL